MDHVTAPNTEGGFVIDERTNYRPVPDSLVPISPCGMFPGGTTTVFKLGLLISIQLLSGGNNGKSPANNANVR